jgi:lipoprotein-anchoring transpeptidase ErfK/SrfK
LGVGLMLAGCAATSATQSPSSTPTAVPPPQVSITPTDGAAGVNPATTVQVTASDGAITTADLQMNGQVQSVTWQKSTSDEWTLSGGLTPGAQYSLQVIATGGGGTETIANSSFTTLGGSRLLTTVYGLDDGATVGVGTVIQLRFNTSIAVADQANLLDHVVVTSDPAQVGGWYWFAANTVDYRPQSFWQSGTTIQIQANLDGVNAGGGYWGMGNWSMGLKVGAKHVTIINVQTHQMQVFNNDQLVNTFPVSTGKAGYLTIGGTLIVWYQAPVVLMDSCTTFETPAACDPGGSAYYKENVYQDTAISTDGYFIHAAPWDCYYAGDESTSGGCGTTNRSFGCVELSPANAATFYSFSQVGDVVEVQNSALAASFTDNEGDWQLPFSDFAIPTNVTPPDASPN